MSFSFNPSYHMSRSIDTSFATPFSDHSDFRSRVSEMIQSVRSRSPPRKPAQGFERSSHVSSLHWHEPIIDRHHVISTDTALATVDPHLIHDSVMQDLHVKLHQQIDLNVKINAEKTELELMVKEERRKFEEIKTRYEQKIVQEQSLREEMERRASQMAEELSVKHRENAELQQKIAQTESQLHSKEVEIKRLREELRRLGEMTNLKIKEMDEKLNQALRTQHTIEKNFIEERDALAREHEANIKTIVHECELRIRQQEEQLRLKAGEAMRLESELARIRDGVQRMVIEHEEKLRAVLIKTREEEAQKMRQMAQEMEGRLRSVTDAKDLMAKRLNDLIRETELNEKRSQERIIVLENELHSYKNEYNNLQVELNNLRSIAQRLKQENDQNSQEILRTKTENADLRAHLNREEESHRQELSRLHMEFNNARKDWETAGEALKRRIVELENMVRQYEAELNRLNTEYKRLVEMLQSNLNQTISTVITEYKGSSGLRSVGIGNSGASQPSFV